MSSFRIVTLFLALLSPLAAKASSRYHLQHGREDIHSLVTQMAEAEGVPSSLAHGIIRVESNYRCNAHNASGASGIGQVMPRTAAGVGVFGNLHDCKTGLRAAMRYLRVIYQKTEGNFCAAASAYASGLISAHACTSYGRRVMMLSSRSQAYPGTSCRVHCRLAR